MALTPCAKWTPDCQGKQDYDGRLISISTRYWPQGGGFYVLTPRRVEGNEARPEIRPSATASILLNYGKPDEFGFGEYITLAERGFEADTEADTKALVEAWVTEQFASISRLVATHYGVAL